MKFIDSLRSKKKELKNILRIRDRLLCSVEYFTPGCAGILKGPKGFFEEKSIQSVLKEYGIITVNFTEMK